MTELAAHDWDAFQALTGRTGLPAERVRILQRRFECTTERPGCPYLLLAGRPDGGLELLLARWLAPEVAEHLLQVGDRPLVIGPAPAQVRPRLGAWPGHPWATYGPGHLLALRSGLAPPADVLAQLGSLGHLEQLVLLTRLSQPLHQHERALARSLATLAATARVLVVAVPGEEPTAQDLAEVTAYAVNQLRQAGFGGRCLGAGVWFTGGDHRSGTIVDVAAFLACSSDEVADGRRGMLRQAVAELLDDLRDAAAQAPVAPQATITEDDCERLTREFHSFLTDLGRELDRLADKGRTLTTEAVRSYVLDTIRGWGSYATIEGSWLKLMERLRPGTQAALLEQVREAVTLLDYEPGRERAVVSESAGALVPERLFTESKRLGVGLGLGLAVYLVVSALLNSGPAVAALPGPVVTLLSYASLAVGVVLGYGAGRLFFPLPQPRSQPEKEPAHPAAVHGWPQLERRLTAWISERLRTRPASPAEECQALARRLGLEGNHP